MNKLLPSLFFGLFIAGNLIHAVDARIILPKPTEFKRTVGQDKKGVNFTLHNQTVLLYEEDNEGAEQIARFMAEALKRSLGYTLPVKTFDSGIFFSDKRPDSSILFTDKKAEKTLGREGYRLNIEKHLITATANHYAGFFNATQTIRQLLPKETESRSRVNRRWTIPACQIKDIPVEDWRACRLDCATNYQTVDNIKAFITQISRYKINTLYWTVTGNGGWRVPIRKYPQLTALGAWRATEEFDPSQPFPTAKNGTPLPKAKRIGGFYSPKDIAEVLQFGIERNVKVIPHIELLNNALVVTDIFPQLRCKLTENQQKSLKFGRQSSYCIGQVKTAVFLEDVAKELDVLFPTDMILVDTEPQTDLWKNCIHCRETLEDEGLTSYAALSDQFIKRVSASFGERKRVLNSSFYKTLDIPALGLKKSYNGWTGHAKKLYHPGLPTNTLLADVPTTGINNQEALLGATLPNIIAYAERLWSAKRSYDSFSKRMGYYYERLDYAGINYQIPAPQTTYDSIEIKEGMEAKVTFDKPINKNFAIYYTTDGTDPYDGSERYTKPITTDKPMTIKARTISQNGKQSRITTVNILKTK